MSAETKGFVAGCTVLIVLILLGIFTEWGASGDPVRIPVKDLIQPRPTRPPHPASIYTPNGWKP